MNRQRKIDVVADWLGLGGPTPMGVLTATPSRGREIFAFEYDRAWLEAGSHQELDPSLALYLGPQYPESSKANFGVFLDSCPDRWGRVLMRRREAQLARQEGREERRLRESDYLLGVHDGHRMGAIRYRVEGRFLDDNDELASPPWTSLRELEHASLQLEQPDAQEDPDYGRWLQMLISPGGSLGGARPKASVRDEQGRLWIAKFPARNDDLDIGAWEAVTHGLASRAGITVPEATLRSFSKTRSGNKHHTYLSRRFDRSADGGRIHIASALTLLGREDGSDATDGASYIELADLLVREGAETNADLEQLWRRIVFFVCVSNTDDHLRNHAFILTDRGWQLSPAYDMNPVPHASGLTLNISETDNSLDLELVLRVGEVFRVLPTRARAIVDEVVEAVQTWPELATQVGIARSEQELMRPAFRIATSA